MKKKLQCGYLIRSEQVVKGENYKNGIEQIKAEGEKTSKGEKIFRYYTTNEDNLKVKIDQLDQKIQDVMMSDEKIYSSDMKLLEEQIDSKVENINRLTDISKLTEYKKEINDLVTKKAKIAGDLSPKGSYLNELIEERKEYENQLNSGSEYVESPISGIVSYKVDGLEEVLNVNSLDSINKEYLEKLDLKTGKIVATSDESGKVIDNFSCYIATILTSENSKNAEVGKYVKIRLSNNIEIPAEIIKINTEESGERIIILKIEKQVEGLIDYRKISFDLIWWSAKGLKVPNQAIVKQDDLDYVVRCRAGYYSKLLVKVTKQGNKYSVVEAYSADELRDLGFSEQEIASYKKIALYDEILLTPDLNSINQ